MQVKVDKFGRMVLPKEIRDDFDIVPGSVLDVEETPDAIVLRPVVEKEPLMVKEGVLAYTGKILDPSMDPVEKSRADRNEFLLGPYDHKFKRNESAGGYFGVSAGDDSPTRISRMGFALDQKGGRPRLRTLCLITNPGRII